MLPDKDTKKIFEFKAFFTGKNNVIENIHDLCQLFTTKSVMSGILPCKSKGFDPVSIVEVLLMMPFMNASNVYSFINDVYNRYFQAGKDCLYELLKDERINWRTLLRRTAKRFISLTTNDKESVTDSTEIRCFIADDTLLSKSGKTIEGISKVHNHVTNKAEYGYKDLTLSYWDGKNHIPVDFSVHNEKGKNKDFGLKAKEREAQFRKDRDKKSNGYKRKQELRKSKIESLIQMLKRAIKYGFMADYMLTDSWFCVEEIIRTVRLLKKGAIHLIAMCKMDKRLYDIGDKKMTAKELLETKKKKKETIKRNRSHKLWYIEQSCIYKGIEVKLFFTRLSKRSKWHLLLTTNTSLDFNETYRIYKIRWTIEVFFKECKQSLGLGKCQSTDFDAQIASITISYMQYILLSLKKRYQSYETLGGAFKDCKLELYENVLSERINLLLFEMIETLVDDLEIDIDVEKTFSLWIEKIDVKSKIRYHFSADFENERKKCA